MAVSSVADCGAEDKMSMLDTSDWPKSVAFPTEYVVTSYSNESPKVGELQGIFRRLSDAKKQAEQLKGLLTVAAVDISVDPGVDDAFPKRAEKLVRAIKKGLGDGLKHCNQFVEKVSKEYDESKHLSGTANDIVNYLDSDAAREAGWFNVKTIATVEGKDAITMATSLANQGYLVIGAISEKQLNANKPMEVDNYDHGHTFVIFPSDIGGWHGALAANAGTGELDDHLRGRVVPLDEVTTNWQRSLYNFFAIHD